VGPSRQSKYGICVNRQSIAQFDDIIWPVDQAPIGLERGQSKSWTVRHNEPDVLPDGCPFKPLTFEARAIPTRKIEYWNTISSTILRIPKCTTIE